jgi:flagellar hook-basal body complex protein FliE
MADGEIKPMRLDTSLSDSIAAATKTAKAGSTASTHKSSSGQSSFKSVLKAAADETKTTTSSSSGSTATAAETSQAVAGHAYSEILTGPRAGMYLNTSHNKRAGQAFVMVERNGVEYHVYGTGKNRTVVEMKRHSAPATTTTAPTTTAGSVTPDTGTTTTTGTSSPGVTAGKITTDTSTL